MMTPTTLMNIIRATGSTSVANDVADLRLAQNLPTATPAPAVRQGAQQTLPQAPFASGPPVTGQGNPTNARPASMEMARPVIAASAHRSCRTPIWHLSYLNLCRQALSSRHRHSPQHKPHSCPAAMQWPLQLPPLWSTQMRRCNLPLSPQRSRQYR